MARCLPQAVMDRRARQTYHDTPVSVFLTQAAWHRTERATGEQEEQRPWRRRCLRPPPCQRTARAALGTRCLLARRAWRCCVCHERPPGPCCLPYVTAKPGEAQLTGQAPGPSVLAGCGLCLPPGAQGAGPSSAGVAREPGRTPEAFSWHRLHRDTREVSLLSGHPHAAQGGRQGGRGGTEAEQGPLEPPEPQPACRGTPPVRFAAPFLRARGSQRDSVALGPFGPGLLPHPCTSMASSHHRGDVSKEDACPPHICEASARCQSQTSLETQSQQAV